MVRKGFQVAALAALLAVPFPASSWDGIDVDSGAVVYIGKGNMVRSGRVIHADVEGDPQEFIVLDIHKSGDDVALILEDENGDERTFIMDGYKARKAKGQR